MLWNTNAWASAIGELAAPSPLHVRTVLVPRGRVAHALRRQLAKEGRWDVLTGTLFLPIPVAARHALQGSGTTFRDEEEVLRRLRLRELFREPSLVLKYFDVALLRRARGWDEAFARTITDLEATGLCPGDLEGSEVAPQLADLAMLWSTVEARAGNSWTTPRIYLEAARLLEEHPQRWPYDGPTFAAVDGLMTEAEARFIRAIPRTSINLLAARPVRVHYRKRLARLFGEEIADAAATRIPEQSDTELGILTSYLFETPDVLCDSDRLRSSAPDGTVHLEEHAGLESEIEAACDWVARSVIERKLPLDQIAILMPTLDPVAGILLERLGRVPWPAGELPVHVAGGLPATRAAGGARLMAIVRALSVGLSADTLASLLPTLRLSGDENRHLSHAEAVNLTYALGTAGGSTTNRDGGLEWSTRGAARERELEYELMPPDATDGELGEGRLVRSARDLERLLGNLRAIRPALDGLVEVYRAILAEVSLADLWKELAGFCDAWLLAPRQGPPVWRLLEEQIRPICTDPHCSSLSGEEALEAIELQLHGLRVPVGRFGEPALYVGTVGEARDIPFQAVRIIGLSEGALPTAPREDPVLPAGISATISDRRLMAADRALADLHALDHVVRNVSEEIVLSAVHHGADRTDREASSVLIEAAAALGRPKSGSSERDRLIPNTTALRRDYFGPARRFSLAFRREAPVSPSGWIDRAAATREVPSSWQTASHLDLARIETLRSDPNWNALDGILEPEDSLFVPAGLTPERPISASALRTLLECPHRFLFERVFYWQEPPSPPSLLEIGPLEYGGLFHRVAEEYFRRHGREFSERRGTLDDFQASGREIADRHFETFLRQYPLVGVTVREQQRMRLRRDLSSFLEYDWNEGGPRSFVDVERAFGEGEMGLELSLPSGALYVRGFIDRIDVEEGRTIVRDMKTGRSKPRTGDLASPDPALDVQIGVYALVVGHLASSWGVPAKLAAAYAYVAAGGDFERAFRDDFDLLRNCTITWLDVSLRMLERRALLRTPRPDDCRYCPFVPVCGPGAHQRASRLLDNATGCLADFRALKNPEPPVV